MLPGFVWLYYTRIHILCSYHVNTLRPRQNGGRFPDDIFKCIFLNENVWISIKISLKFVPRGPINNIPALVQIMAWRRQGDKPLSESMMVRLLTHICVTRPQWVNYTFTICDVFCSFLPDLCIIFYFKSTILCIKCILSLLSLHVCTCQQRQDIAAQSISYHFWLHWQLNVILSWWHCRSWLTHWERDKMVVIMDLDKNCCILLDISLKLVPMDPINIVPALVQIVAWG